MDNSAQQLRDQQAAAYLLVSHAISPEHVDCSLHSTALERYAVVSEAVNHTGLIALPLNPESRAEELKLSLLKYEPKPTVLIITSLGGNQWAQDAARELGIRVVIGLNYANSSVNLSVSLAESTTVPGSATVSSPSGAAQVLQVLVDSPPLQPAGIGNVPVAADGFSNQDWFKSIVSSCVTAGVTNTFASVEIPNPIPWTFQGVVILISFTIAVLFVSEFINPRFASIGRRLKLLVPFLGATVYFMLITIRLPPTGVVLVWAIYVIAAVAIAVSWILP